jgi:hypothetical protein
MDRPALARDRASGTPNGLSRRRLLLGALLTAGSVGAAAAAPIRGGGRPSSFAAIDADHDGTIDLAEAKHAAELLFDQLDRNKNGKLSRAELGRRRISAAEFRAADADHDGTLTKEEYLALVERQFKAADLDHDGTVSEAEFESRSGLPLRRLVY